MTLGLLVLDPAPGAPGNGIGCILCMVPGLPQVWAQGGLWHPAAQSGCPRVPWETRFHGQGSKLWVKSVGRLGRMWDLSPLPTSCEHVYTHTVGVHVCLCVRAVGWMCALVQGGVHIRVCP